VRRFAKWALVVVVLLLLIGALNGPDADKGAALRAAAPSATATPTPSPTPRPATRRQRPAKTPVPTAIPTTKPVALVSCDPNIRVRAATTTCPFAENVFYAYYQETFGYPAPVTVRAWSAAAARWFTVRCSGDEAIDCRAGDGAQVKFSGASVAAYDDEQANRFASTHDIGDQPVDGIGQNIPNYENGTGYRVQCADGMYSHSGGRPGACSGHGGVGYDPSGSPSDDGAAAPDYGSGDEIPNYDNGTGYRVQCADGMYSHSGGRPGACSGHGGVG
jgi:hypothetical protein